MKGGHGRWVNEEGIPAKGMKDLYESYFWPLSPALPEAAHDLEE